MTDTEIKKYKYKYELHLHSSEASACARSTAVEMCEACKNAGYDGFFITNHAWGGNTCVDRSLPWKAWVREFSKPYYLAKEWGDQNDFKVFFGYESGYNGTEFLIYGVTPEWLEEHEELHDATVAQQLKIVHEGGGIVVHAHPFREEWYIPEVRLFPDDVDGVEGVNATHASHLSKSHNNPEFDVKAIAYAREHSFFMTAGSDVHSVYLFGGGIMTKDPINSPKDLINLLKSDTMYLMTDGDRYYDRYGNIVKEYEG